MTQHSPFEQTINSFLRALEGGNKSVLTLTAYKTDLMQFFPWLSENDVTVTAPGQVMRGHINEYLAVLASKSRSGVTRARKLAALKSFFTYLNNEQLITASPAETITCPTKSASEKLSCEPMNTAACYQKQEAIPATLLFENISRTMKKAPRPQAENLSLAF